MSDADRPGRRWLAQMLGHHRPCGLPDTLATRRLPRFQRDAAVRLLDILSESRGAILADGVGLGKTHIAVAVLRSRPGWRPALVVAPAVVRPDWEAELLGVPGIECTSYAQLSRDAVAPPPGGYALIVLDEAHRLRNPATKRYRALARLAATARLLLVTASPVHNSAEDLAALVSLFCPETGSGGDDLERLRSLVSAVLVRRVRRTVQRAYTPAQRHIRGLGELPARSQRIVEVRPSDPVVHCLAALPLLSRAALPDRPSTELTGLLTMLLARRLESSPAALRVSLERCRNYLIRADEASRHGERLSRRGFRALFGDDPIGQVSQYLLPFFFDGPGETPSDWLGGLPALDEAIGRLRRLESASDAKVAALSALLEHRPGPSVVMTGYCDTADYLFRRLAGERWLLTGRSAWSSRFGRTTRRAILDAFGPRANSRHRQGLLIATDVLGEGVNLQAAQQLVHYDRPWNPVVVEQRMGRIDRLGAAAETVTELALRLAGPFDAALRLEERLALKREVARRVFAGHPEADSEEWVGLDLDGLLMACAARLEEPAADLDKTNAPGGSLIAVGVGDRVALYWWDEDGLRAAMPSLLIALAVGRIAGRVIEEPSRDAVAAAIDQARSAAFTDWLLKAEPGAGTGRTRETARALGLRALDAHRRGDVASLRSIGEPQSPPVRATRALVLGRVELLGVLEIGERPSGRLSYSPMLAR